MTEEEQRETIISRGAELREELIELLGKSYEYRVGFIGGGRKLNALQRSFQRSHGKFLVYDGSIFEYLSDTPINRGIEPYSLELRKRGWDKLAAQREIIQSLLNSIDGSLSSTRAELINKRAILIALLALLATIIIGVISICVVYLAQPIILYPVTESRILSKIPANMGVACGVRTQVKRLNVSAQ